MQMIGDRLIGAAFSVATVVLVAALTHFAAVLILPKVASKDAYSVLSPRSSGTGMALVPASRPGRDVIPFRDPATIQGLCSFDLTNGPVRIRTKTAEGRLLTLSFRTPEGKIFYSMTDRAALRDVIDIRLVNEAQLKEIEADDDEEAGLPSELRLKAPTRKGLIVATALVARPGDGLDAEAQIRSVTCAPEPLPPPQG